MYWFNYLNIENAHLSNQTETLINTIQQKDEIISLKQKEIDKLERELKGLKDAATEAYENRLIGQNSHAIKTRLKEMGVEITLD